MWGDAGVTEGDPAEWGGWDKDYPETACAECGGPCLDHNDGVGIHRGDDSICGDCAEAGGW